ncbi:MAG: diguanylate cyclase domain-containing protein, partial [Spirochaetales bacterium]
LTWFSDRVKIQRVDANERVQMLLGVTLDASRTKRHDTTLCRAIEERDNMLRTLKQREASLKRLSDFSRNVLANMSEGVLVIDEPTGRVSFLNESAASLFGVERSEASEVEWPRVLPESTTESIAELLSTLSTEEAAECEVAVPRRWEGYRWILLRGSRLTEDAQTWRYIIVASDVSSWKERERHLRDISLIDEVTGLPNRRFLTERLTEAIARRSRNAGDPLVVLFIDLDGFKAVNDLYGHLTGDMLLREIGRRLDAELRASDVVARYGGDEFVAILESLTSEERVTRVVERLTDIIRRPFIVNAKPLRTDASIGIAVYGDDGETPEELIRRADEAMYVAKSAVPRHSHSEYGNH